MTEDQIKQIIEAVGPGTEIVCRKITDFVNDLRELGQTEICASSPDYEITLKIKPKELN